MANKMLSVKQSLRPCELDGCTSSAGCNERSSARMSSSERYRRPPAGADAILLDKEPVCHLLEVASFGPKSTAMGVEVAVKAVPALHYYYHCQVLM